MEIVPGPQLYKDATEAANFIQDRLPKDLHNPSVGVICGSGLGGLSGILTQAKCEISFGDIPHFLTSTVQGHAGKLVIGKMPNASGRSIIMMVGRVHFYEGHSIQGVTFPIRVMKLLGVESMIVTNAAGGLNPSFAVGDLVALNDHINLAGISGNHPLRGINADDFGVRFPPLSEAYDLELRRRVHQVWGKLEGKNRKLHEGIYAYVSGPSYETRAECRMLRSFGADLVGMSTVPEIIVARHCDMRVLAMSLVTNSAVLEPGLTGDDPTIQSLTADELKDKSAAGKANHQEVLEAGRQAASDMQRLVQSLLEVES